MDRSIGKIKEAPVCWGPYTALVGWSEKGREGQQGLEHGIPSLRRLQFGLKDKKNGPGGGYLDVWTQIPFPP